MLGDPAALGAEDALQNYRPMAGVDQFVQTHIPSSGGVERVEHALYTVGRFFVQGEPAPAHDAASLTKLLGDQMAAVPTVRLIGIERSPSFTMFQISWWIAPAASLWLIADDRPHL